MKTVAAFKIRNIKFYYVSISILKHPHKIYICLIDISLVRFIAYIWSSIILFSKRKSWLSEYIKIDSECFKSFIVLRLEDKCHFIELFEWEIVQILCE